MLGHDDNNKDDLKRENSCVCIYVLHTTHPIFYILTDLLTAVLTQTIILLFVSPFLSWFAVLLMGVIEAKHSKATIFKREGGDEYPNLLPQYPCFYHIRRPESEGKHHLNLFVISAIFYWKKWK